MIKKSWIYVIVPALILLGGMVYLLAAGESSAENVRQSVVRFHVVAASDSEEDQELKLKVRDGVFSLVKKLFADCGSREEALRMAQESSPLLQAEAERILRENGRDETVTLEVGSRFFPTKDYGALSFPAGHYQAVSVRIGAGSGKNFWCVLYPALCIAPAVAEDTAADEIAAVAGKDSVDFLQKKDEKQKIKFALVEWFEHIRQKYLKS